MLHMKVTQENKEKFGENYGKAWTPEEEAQLLDSIAKNKDVEVIAKDLKRSPGSITGKLKNIAVKMNNDGKTLIEIMNATKITTFEIKHLIETDIYRKEKINKTKAINKNIIINVMKEIVEALGTNCKQNQNDIINALNIYIKSKEDQNIIVEKKDENIDLKVVEEKETKYVFDDKMLEKMKKYKDDKDKLKELRKKHEIPKDVFYEKINEL